MEDPYKQVDRHSILPPMRTQRRQGAIPRWNPFWSPQLKDAHDVQGPQEIEPRALIPTERTRPEFSQKPETNPLEFLTSLWCRAHLLKTETFCRNFGRVSPINWTFPKIYTCMKTQFIFSTGSMHNIISCNSCKWPSAFQHFNKLPVTLTGQFMP